MKIAVSSFIRIDDTWKTGVGVEPPTLTIKVNDKTNTKLADLTSSMIIPITTNTQKINTASSSITTNKYEVLPQNVAQTSLRILSYVSSVFIFIKRPESMKISYNGILIKSQTFNQKYVESDTIIKAKVNREIKVSSETILKRNPYFIPIYFGRSAFLKVKSSEGISFLKASVFLHIINLVPDYLSTLRECRNVIGGIPELRIPVKIGELIKIIEFEEEIEKIYNKPFSIYFNGREVYGRLIRN